MVAAGEAFAAGVAVCVAEAAGDAVAPEESGWFPPSIFGSLSILSASLLTTVASLIALRINASLRMVCRWLMSACLIWSCTPVSSSLSGLFSS